MKTWLTLTEAAERIRAEGTALASAERRIRRWIEAGELAPLAGRVRTADLLATEKKMRSRRGRPRKNAQIGN
ncbi:hypothetical protein [Microbacterium maritypicum]|uniref:Uncharacterized protein n=1 Tax=Microbacterium maritypicum MF109 TaxID=1333857 RepID=T5KYK1_MICMQ|nr:hypothetical protein [Microbacterium liquefaciens]EQM83400.1 hypothetical protein L687_12335 [Microbacterium maritypicum MF109]